MREFLKYTLTKYTVSLYLLSTVLLLIDAFIPETFFIKSFSKVLTIFGTGIFITTFVTSILNFYFKTDIHRYFSVISGAEKSNILKIYPKRKYAVKEMESEFEKARGDIRLLSIAGTNFFHAESSILKSIDELCADDSNCNVQILLLDPRSKHAVDRSLIEEGFNVSTSPLEEFKYLNKTVWIHILTSLFMLEQILQDSENKNNFKIEIRTYDTAPILLYVQVNKRAFVEQYHYGITEEERKTSLTKCLGKKVPVMEFSTNSLQSQLWQSHFDYIWDTSADREIYPGFYELLSKIMQTENSWLNNYNEIRKISEKYLSNLHKEKKNRKINSI